MRGALRPLGGNRSRRARTGCWEKPRIRCICRYKKDKTKRSAAAHTERENIGTRRRHDVLLTKRENLCLMVVEFLLARDAHGHRKKEERIIAQVDVLFTGQRNS